jgi:hypothetical protein
MKSNREKTKVFNNFIILFIIRINIKFITIFSEYTL